MPLTKVQQTIIANRLNELTGHNATCPLCRHPKMLVGPDVYMLPQFNVPTKRMHAGGQPCVTLICERCGSVQLFNVFTSGLAEVVGLNPADAVENIEP